MRTILALPAVDHLIGLDPPLETVLTSKHELLSTLEAEHAISEVREFRTNVPRRALGELCRLLFLIRNKRIHGFKTPQGPRDREILESAGEILTALTGACLEASLPEKADND